MNVNKKIKSNAFGLSAFGLSAFTLKCIAILSMLIDHIGAGLFPDQMWMRIVGRLAFPIFAFLLSEGFYHTRSIKRYAFRLGIFALISEIPFNLLHNDHIFDPDAQNIFITLLIGLLTIYGVEKYRKHPRSYYSPAILLIGIMIAQLLRTDYGGFGVALIYIFHYFRDKRKIAAACVAVANLAYGLLQSISGYVPLQMLAGAAAIPILMYNGKKGYSMKYAFYAFYPAHISVIMAIKYIVSIQL